jgi:hypothetical protein
MLRRCGCVAGLAAVGRLLVRLLVYHLAHQSEHTPYNIPDDDLARLCCDQPSADLADALHQLRGVSSLELPYDA